MRTDGRTDMTKLIVAFRNFENAPKIDIAIKKLQIIRKNDDEELKHKVRLTLTLLIGPKILLKTQHYLLGCGGTIVLIHSFSILYDDRFKESSKTIPPHSAI
jgi:hypothetical protein